MTTADMSTTEVARAAESTAETCPPNGGTVAAPRLEAGTPSEAEAAPTAPVPSLENVRRSQEAVEDAYLQATEAMRNGQLEDAAAQFRKILFAHPDHTRARANLGNCQFLLGDLANAEAAFRAALAEDANNHNALYGLASILIRQGNLDEAQELAARLAALLPDSAPALTLLGDATTTDPRPGTAIAAYRAALRIDDGYAPALTGLSRLMLKRSRLDEARDLAERATLSGAVSAEAFTCLADVLAAQGDLVAARNAYETSLRLEPGDAGVKVRLSLLARKAGDLRAALRHADDAWTDQSDNREAGNAVGAALAAMGERLAAREILTAIANGLSVPDWVRDVIERHRTVPMPDLVWSPHSPLQSQSADPVPALTVEEPELAGSADASDPATAADLETTTDNAEPDNQIG